MQKEKGELLIVIGKNNKETIRHSLNIFRQKISPFCQAAACQNCEKVAQRD